MIARVQTNKLFSGKIYAKGKPNSCVVDPTDSLDFELPLGYHDLLCEVRQKQAGRFSSDIVIQHHDQVVTTKDLGLSLNCNYDLSNKSVSNYNPLSVNGYVSLLNIVDQISSFVYVFKARSASESSARLKQNRCECDVCLPIEHRKYPQAFFQSDHTFSEIYKLLVMFKLVI